MDFLNEELPEEQALENTAAEVAEESVAEERIPEQPAEETIVQEPVETATEEALPESMEEKPKKESWQKRLFKDARDVVFMLAIFMLVYILCFRTVVVVGSSMYDTLVDGDRLILVNNLLYWEPQQGDIIVASKHSFRDGECIIKRVIATEGQKVRIDFESGTVYVDEEAIDEPYLHSFTLNQESEHSEWIVQEGCLFVMGDNRMESLDSRSNSIGFIDKREVLGRAVFLMLPGYDEENDIRDFSRIGVIG